jgi:hypothetical protein
MIFFLQQLEPIRLKKGQLVFGEIDSVNMVVFLTDGSIDFGYDINRITKYKIRKQGNFQIGGFELTFKRRSQLFQKASKS